MNIKPLKRKMMRTEQNPFAKSVINEEYAPEIEFDIIQLKQLYSYVHYEIGDCV